MMLMVRCGWPRRKVGSTEMGFYILTQMSVCTTLRLGVIPCTLKEKKAVKREREREREALEGEQVKS